MSPLSRRDFLKTTAAGGLALAAGDLLSGAPQALAATPKRGGTLRVGLTGGGPSETLKPLNALLATDTIRTYQLYDPLVIQAPDGTPTLYLADEITPNANATHWTIRVKKGVTFHDGKDLTADDVISSFQAEFSKASPGEGEALLASIDVAGIKKLDKYTVSVPCKTPFATLIETLAVPSTFYIFPSNFNLAKPVGSGPFKYESFTPGQELSLLRNENYWNQPYPYVDRMVMTDFADETSQVNALIAGQLDAIGGLDVDVLSQIQSAGKKTTISAAAGTNPFTMNCAKGVFADNRVRTAMKLIVDRQQMLELVFLGHGTLAKDVFGLAAPEYDHALPERKPDIEKAKSLLKAAGVSNFTVTLTSAPVAQGVTKMAQVLAQQAAAAGVKVNIQQDTVSQYFGPSYPNYTFGQTYWYNYYYFPQAAAVMIGTAFDPETHFSSDRYNSLYTQALRTPDLPKRKQIAAEMQLIEYNEGGYLIPFFPPVIDAYSTNVHGAYQSKSGLPFNADFKSLWLS
jgi:peptide/nickel transport system substrate-binding protein